MNAFSTVLRSSLATEPRPPAETREQEAAMAAAEIARELAEKRRPPGLAQAVRHGDCAVPGGPLGEKVVCVTPGHPGRSSPPQVAAGHFIRRWRSGPSYHARFLIGAT